MTNQRETNGANLATPALVYMYSPNAHARHLAWRALKRQGRHWQNPARNETITARMTTFIRSFQTTIANAVVPSFREFANALAQLPGADRRVGKGETR